MKTLVQWVKTNSTMLVNAGSLVGTTAVTSILGVVYWWLAARRFPPEVVGIASASVSAMMLLGGLSMLGLGTLLLTELPRQPGQESSLINTALIVVGGVGGCVGILFAIIAPYVSTNFLPLRASIADVVNFAAGVGLTVVTLVLDQALIGLLRGGLQLWRNTLFAVAKLIALFVISLLLSHTTGMTIYATWTSGNALSLAALALFVMFKRRGSIKTYQPQWGLLRKLGPAAFQHHLLNSTLQVPTLALPLLVTALLSARMNAWFYVSWMIANFVFIVPAALTTVLHTMNSAQQSTLAYKARVTISLAFVTSLLANCLLQFDTKLVLSLFGSTYADQAAWTLRILVLGAFPIIIKNHFISIHRIQDRIVSAMFVMVPGGCLELGAAALGAHLGGLSGLSLGWIAAVGIESLFMFPTIYKYVWSKEASLRKDYIGTEAIWLIETSKMPSIRQSYRSTESDRSKKRVLRDGSTAHDNNGKPRLKPPRLQPFMPSQNGSLVIDTPATDKIVDSGSQDNIPIKDRGNLTIIGGVQQYSKAQTFAESMDRHGAFQR